MKKNILLILLFITLFFSGSTNTFAKVRCEASETGCLENLQEYMGEINGKLACLYEVQFNNKTYYNYIYYGRPSNKKIGIYAGTTLGGLSEEVLQADDSAWLLGEAYASLYNNNQCPKNSYLDDGWINFKEICFDDDGTSCKNMKNIGTDFSSTTKSELKKNNSSALLYDELNFINSCEASKLPENYTKSCRYVDSSNSQTMILLYGNNKNTLIYTNGEERRIIDNNGFIPFGNAVYTNKISGSINSCPSNIYINNYEESVEIKGAIYDNNTLIETSTNINANSTIKLDYYDCNEKEEIIIDDDNNCDEFISPELRDMINDIMNMIRIAVPILLIGLITYDFATAVFAGADDKINKAKSRAIKRVIIAIVIFFVPTLVNFVFNIVNEVWGTNFGTCNIGHDE